jgi:hypothetical protein
VPAFAEFYDSKELRAASLARRKPLRGLRDLFAS